jgi:DNA-binding response OmpR family regulator
MRLLMIDDDAEIGAFVRAVAEPLGYTVATHVKPAEFTAALDHDGADVIVLDLTIPETDGFELLRQLARRGLRARIFIISGFDPEHQRMALTLGQAQGLDMAGIIPKPVRAAELRALLASALQAQGRAS